MGRLTGSLAALAFAVLLAAVPPSARAQKAREPGPGRARRVVVVPLTPGQGVEPKLASALTDSLVADLASRGLSVATARDVEMALALEHKTQVLSGKSGGRADDLASALEGDRILSGNVLVVGKSTVVTVQVFEARNAAVARVFQEQLEDATTEALFEAMSRAGDQLFPGTSRSGGAARRIGADAARIALRSEVPVACAVDGGVPVPVGRDRETAVPLNPGPRVVRCTTPGYSEFLARLELRPGALVPVEVRVHDLAAAARGRRNGYIALGVGLAAGGVAGYGFWQAHDVDSKLRAPGAPMDGPWRRAQVSRGETGNVVGVAGSIAAGLSLAAAGYFFAFSY